MSLITWLIFILITFISFILMTKLKMFDIDRRYSNFKFVTIILFVWTIHTWLRMVVSDDKLQYYLGMNLYPIVLIIVGVLLLAIMKFLEMRIRPITKIIIWVLFVAEIILVNTNDLHQSFMLITSADVVTYQIFVGAQPGQLFLVHTLICYVMLFLTIFLLLRHLYKNLKQEQDYFPFMIVIVGIIVGLILNIIHIFIYTFIIDPTYIAFVIILSIFYFVVYIRDIRLILLINRNTFLLENLREMYLVVNQRDEVVDASEEFLKSFNVSLNERITFNDVMNSLNDRVVVYGDENPDLSEFNPKKRYLHMHKKTIHLPLFKYDGTFYLFFDETSNKKNINDINYARNHDLMTKLYNRNYFEEIKDDIYNKHKMFSLILFDLDGLKLYNDYLGHKRGDDLLKDFATKLSGLAKEHNFITIRMGGDEFLMIALDITKEELQDKVQPMLDQDCDILFSYGISGKIREFDDVERVLVRADKQMYLMKAKNKNKKVELEESLKNNKEE